MILADQGLAQLLEQRFGPITGSPSTPDAHFGSQVAAIVPTAAGEVFVKASAPGSWQAHDYRVEARVLAALPSTVRAPRFLGLLHDIRWIALCTSVIDGQPTAKPTDADVEPLTQMYLAQRKCLDPAPAQLRGPAGRQTRVPGLARPRSRPTQALSVGTLPEAARRLVPRLAEAEARWTSSAAGDARVHFDPRPDNQLWTPSGPVLVDWSRACLAAGWVDVVTWMPFVHGTGHDVRPRLRGLLQDERHPSRVIDYMSALTGYWLDAAATAAPDAPVEFQRTAGAGALDLLTALT